MAYLKAPAGTRGPGSWPFLAREPCTRLVNSRGYKRARLQGRFGASNSSGSDNTGSSGDPEVQENLVKLLNEQVGANQGHTQSSAAETSSSPNSSGNPEVQNTLSKLVKLQVGAEQVKARAAEGSETLKQTAEEAKEELERLRQVATDRSNLGFGSALADVNQAADEVAEMLRISREKIEANDADFAQWQYDMARRRSQGQFFQNLYTAEDPGRPASRQAARAVDGSAAQAAPSLLTQNIFSFLTAVLVLAVIADVVSGAPSFGQDLLYAGIAASMAVSLWLGRQKKVTPSDHSEKPQ
ncbi:hypothetical protein WJX74_007463 [Apatococcus lobatus]|uniref:Uncharacterized protein n=1 Tax=Apatococcus lobatus TaxID=904363 RepID=A0AAW1RVF9_9CHLO